MADLPPGFVLDKDLPPKTRGAPPPGFVLDSETPPKQPPPTGALRTMDDLARAIASGATGGYADEFAAMMSNLTGVGGQGEGSYSERLKAEQARDVEIPLGVQIPGEVAGGVATTAIAAPIAGATKMGQLFARLPPWLQTTGLGALWGGVYGSGTAKEGERLKGAAIGAPLGAVTGAGLHGLVAGGKKVGGKVAGYLRGRANPEAQAARVLGEKIRQDQITPERIRARLRELGPQATIADAGGENILGLARGAAGAPGPAKTRIMQTLEGRAAGEAERVSKQVTKHLGPGDYFAAEDQFLAKLQQGAREAYQAAYQANPEIITPRLARMLKAPIAQKALKEAADIAGIERAAGNVKWLGPVDKELTDAARYAAELGKAARPERPGLAKGLSLETWDYVKRGLDSLLDKPAYRNELTQRLNKKGAVVNDLKKTLVRALDTATGGEKSLYAKARAQYAGDAEVLGALRSGAKFFKQSPDAIRREMADMSTGAQEAYRNGAARAVLDIVENTPDTASVARRLFNKSMSRNKIRAVFPDQGEFHDFSRRMVAEQRFTKTQQAIGSGSRTAPMAQEIADVQRMAGNIGAVMGSEIPGGGHALVKAGIGRRMAQGLLGQSEELNKALARALTTRNRADQLRILDMLAPHARQPGASPLLRGLVLGATQQESRAVGGR